RAWRRHPLPSRCRIARTERTACRTVSIRPRRLAIDALSVKRASLDHTVRTVLDAEEIQRRIGVVPPSSCRRRADAQDRAFRDVDALAVEQELASASDNDVHLVVLLVPVQ